MKTSSFILIAVAAGVILTGTVVWRLRAPAVPESAADASVSQATPSSSSRLARVHDRQLALAERVKAAREISSELSNEELRDLMATLSRPLDERTADQELMAINEIMDRLRVTGMACGEYATVLCSLIRSDDTHPVVRDYAMQHAVQWIRTAKSGHSLSQVSDADRENMLSCMVSYLQKPASLSETGYGTALNLIRSLANEYPAEAAEIVSLCGTRITEVAAGRESGPLANRITAIQSLPMLPDHEEALALVRGMTADAPGGSPVRLVAIATLGSLGEEADLATLRQIQGEDSDFSHAARSAATRLESRLLSSSR
jgi:hypothetical protein